MADLSEALDPGRGWDEDASVKTTTAAAKAEGPSPWREADSEAARGGTCEKT